MENAISLLQAVDLPDPSEASKRLNYSGVRTISEHAMIAFAYHVVGNNAEAKTNMNQVFDLLKLSKENGFLSAEHIKGITLVADLLHDYIETGEKVQFTKADFEKLSKQSQAVVLGLKNDFVQHLEPQFWEGCGTPFVNSIITLEPNYYEWYLFLYALLWHSYREPHNWKVKREILQKMEAALLKASALSPKHPQVQLFFCEFAIQKYKSVRYNAPMHCIGKRYQNIGHLVQEMQQITK